MKISNKSLKVVLPTGTKYFKGVTKDVETLEVERTVSIHDSYRDKNNGKTFVSWRAHRGYNNALLPANAKVFVG